MKKGSPKTSFFLRKARDSNPRIREDRRLSKPLHSTTLPAFHAAKV